MNGKTARIRAYAKILAGMIVLGLFVYLVISQQIAPEFTERLIWLIVGGWLFGDGVMKTTQQ